MSAAVDGDGPRSRSPSRSESDLSDRSNGSSYTGSTYGSTVSRQSSSDGDRGDDSGVKGRQGDGRSDSADQARTNGTAAAPAAANGHANGSAAPAPAAPRPVPPVKGKKGLKPQGSKWFFEDGQVGQVMTTPPSSARLNGHSGAAGGDSQAAEAASGRGGQSRWSSLLGQVSRKGRSGAKGATAATDSLDSTAQSEGDGASASVATDRGGQTAQSSAASLSSTEGLGGDQLTGGPDRMTSMPALRTGEAPSSAAGVLPSTSPGRAAKNLSATLARASNAHSDSEEEEEEEKGVDDVSARSGSVTPSSYSDSASRSTGTYSSRSRSYSHSHSTGSVTPRSHSRSASHSGGEGPAEPEAVRENRASSQEEVVQQQQHEGEQEPGAVPQAPRESSPTEGHSEDEASSRGHARSPPLRTSAYGDTHYPGFEDGIYESFVQPMAGSVRRVYPPAHRPVSRGLDEPASGAEETGPDDAIAWVMDGPDSAELDADKPPPGREEVDKEGYPLYSRHYITVPTQYVHPDYFPRKRKGKSTEKAPAEEEGDMLSSFAMGAGAIIAAPVALAAAPFVLAAHALSEEKEEEGGEKESDGEAPSLVPDVSGLVPKLTGEEVPEGKMPSRRHLRSRHQYQTMRTPVFAYHGAGGSNELAAEIEQLRRKVKYEGLYRPLDAPPSDEENEEDEE